MQTCIVHLIRNCLDYAGWKDRKPIATALKTVYRAIDAEAAALALNEFEESPWGQKYPAITAAWRRNWAEVIPFFAFPQDVRRMIYTTNAIESLNSTIRRSVRVRGTSPVRRRPDSSGYSCARSPRNGRTRRASGIPPKRSSVCCSAIASRCTSRRKSNEAPEAKIRE